MFFLNNTKMLAASVAAALTFSATTASAVTIRVLEGGVEIGSVSDPVATVSITPLSTGGSITLNTAATQDFPLQDQLNSTFSISGEAADVMIQVSHFFDNGLPVPVTGEASFANNFLATATGVTNETFLGTSLFDMSNSVGSLVGGNSASSIVNFGIANSGYYITQVFSVASTTFGGTATSEFAAPVSAVPVPASLLLLGTALGGLGLSRRFKAKKA